ncbi:helix-turn-helix domain-containing protein [Weissella sp. MSCH1]|uniref:helix-turn-helix domain-containing protein n=1 Tax=Weissella sp. MSCH1 TaxID=3383343 RepID=UPI003896E259
MSSSIIQKQLLHLSEAAEYLGISFNQFNKYVRNDPQLKIVKIGEVLLVPVKSLDQYMEDLPPVTVR